MLQRTYLPDHDLMALSGAPAVYHCHHFNLFLDQSIDDALGPQKGTLLRFSAARHAARQLIAGVATTQGAVTATEKLQIASAIFSMMGHGTLRIMAKPSGGEATGEHLHYGHTWMEKYGRSIRRNHPADAFAAGFAAAAAEVAFELGEGSISATETQCVATRATSCSFQLKPETTTARPNVLRGNITSFVKPTFVGEREAEVAAIAAGLRDFTAGVAGDARGLVQAFGVYVTAHLACYYNQISYDAVEHLQKEMPGAVGIIEDLLRESGHVCVFNTFGGILLSPEWEAMVGPLTGNPVDTVVGCLAIARALGFGHWTLAEYSKDRLVITTPSSYESAYYLARHGQAPYGNEYFLQGATLAIAQLADRVDWKAKPKLTQEYYDALFRGGRLPWKVEQPRSLATGDTLSQVVASRVK